jgi:hypothetical protein
MLKPTPQRVGFFFVNQTIFRRNNMEWQYLVLTIAIVVMLGYFLYYYLKPIIDNHRSFGSRLTKINIRCRKCGFKVKTMVLTGHLPDSIVCPLCKEGAELKLADTSVLSSLKP